MFSLLALNDHAQNIESISQQYIIKRNKLTDLHRSALGFGKTLEGKNGETKVEKVKQKNLNRTDAILLDLRRTFAKFIESVSPFEYKNKTYRLIDSYVALPWTQCNVCGHHPIRDVFVIRSSDGKRLRVGSGCIDHITNRKIADYFRKYMRKCKNVIGNRRHIDGLALILTAYKRAELSFWISEDEIERLEKAYERMCNGYNLNREKRQFVEWYINMVTCS
jgi:hypothetical protein